MLKYSQEFGVHDSASAPGGKQPTIATIEPHAITGREKRDLEIWIKEYRDAARAVWHATDFRIVRKFV